MRKRSRVKAFLDGVASILEIMPQPIKRPWRYEDGFGTDGNQPLGTWDPVSDDMMRAIENEQGDDQEAPRP